MIVLLMVFALVLIIATGLYYRFVHKSQDEISQALDEFEAAMAADDYTERFKAVENAKAVTEKAVAFWSGDGGNEYHERNTPVDRTFFWHGVLSGIGEAYFDERIYSAFEFGAGRGDNLRALKALGVKVTGALEVNKSVSVAKADSVWRMPVQDFSVEPGLFAYDLVLTRGFLIHLPPEDLPATYDKIAMMAKKYVVLAEYYSPSPRPVQYRGKEGLLWTRDFAGEFMDRHPEFHLVDYGFVYHRDATDPQDDVTWFLMERGK